MSGRVNKNWLELDPLSPDAVTATDISYDSTASIKAKIGALESGEAGVTREIEYYTLSATNISDKYIILDGTSVNEEIDMVVLGGPTQRYQVDFVLIGANKISWSEFDTIVGMEGDLLEGDVLQITYTKAP